MSYRCQVCKAHVWHRVPLMRHTRYRKKVDAQRALCVRLEISQEIPVCKECQAHLAHREPKPVLEAIPRLRSAFVQEYTFTGFGCHMENGKGRHGNYNGQYNGHNGFNGYKAH